MPQSTPKRVVIVGGSLAGLFTGIVLQRSGHDVTILERTPSSTLVDQGAGITPSTIVPPIFDSFASLIGSGSPILHFFEQYDRTATGFYVEVPREFQYLKRDGSVKSKIPIQVPATGTSWAVLYTLLRANFDGGYEKDFIAAAERKEGDGKAEYLSGLRVLDIQDQGADLVNVQYADASGENFTLEANLVIGADGPSSTVRKLFDPEAQRTYVGYAAWRGTVREDLLSEETQAVLGNTPTFYYYKGGHVVLYTIPGANGSLAKGSRLQNLVWYCNYTAPELADILTDTAGATRPFSLGIGKIRPEIQSRQLEVADRILPPPLAEIFRKIEQPFVQAITDNAASKAVFMDGKVLLVGDALAGLRPHTTAGTAQAAMNALLLQKVFGATDEMGVGPWEEKVLGWAKGAQMLGVKMGELAQFGDHPQADKDDDVAKI